MSITSHSARAHHQLYALTRSFPGVIHGFELNPVSAQLAARHAAEMGLDGQYRVRHPRAMQHKSIIHVDIIIHSFIIHVDMCA